MSLWDGSTLRKRYFRKTIGNPDGALVHHGDCWFSVVKICTCGLLHDLLPLSNNSELYPNFDKEDGERAEATNKLQGF